MSYPEHRQIMFLQGNNLCYFLFAFVDDNRNPSSLGFSLNPYSAQKVDKIMSAKFPQKVPSKLHHIENTKIRQQMVYIRKKRLIMSHMLFANWTIFVFSASPILTRKPLKRS